MPEMKNNSLLRKLALIFVCLAIAVIVAWQYGGDRHVTKIPQAILKGTGFLTFKARVNGKEILMAVDTAANTTVFDLALVDELQLESQGRAGTSFRAVGDVPLHTAHIKEFRVGNVSYHGDFPFVDLSHANEGVETTGDPAIEGLLGADILIKWNAVIDYKDLSLVIWSP